MLLNASDCGLVVVDLQARLVPALADPEVVVRRARLLLQAAARLDVPVLATEQSPASIGHTVESVAAALPSGAVVEKTAFAATREARFQERAAALDRPRLVVCGAEAHVCVLQTALGLIEAGYAVAIAADAAGSRRMEDRELALARLRDAGADVVTSEMVVFEWLQRAGTDAFRALIPLIKDD